MAQMNKEVLRVFGFLSVLLLIQRGHAFEFKVGGSNGWTVPSDSSAASAMYNQWAEKNRFQIGDTLLFVYSADQDSVLQVTKDDYTNCNTGSPLEKFADGHTEYKFNKSGPHYFISGVAEHCHKNEKLAVVVMADRRTAASPPPSPSPPSPAPAGEESPSPPSPAPSEESSPPSPPAEAPSDESSPPKKNSGSTTVASVVGTVAVFVGSCLF